MENDPLIDNLPIVETTPAIEENLNPEFVPIVDDTSEILPLPAVPPAAVPRKFRLLLGLILGAVVLVCFVVLTAAVYLLPVNDNFVRSVASVVPYPIAVVNMHPITFGQFYKEWAAMESYYQSDPSLAAQKPADSELATSLVDSMVNRIVIEQLANQYGLKLDTAKVDETYQSAVQQSVSEEAFLTEINKTFGWDKQQVINKLIAPMVLSSQVETAIQTDSSLQSEALAKANDALARIKNNEDFAAVATDVSDDPSADKGGDIGSLAVDQLPEEWVSFISVNGLNKPSDVIDLGSVYSIVMATDQTENAGVTQYNIKLIIVFKKSTDEVVTTFEEASKIWNFLKVSEASV